MYVPSKLFLTKGVGRHREKLASLEQALRRAGIASFNLVKVSSIYPPGCKVISRADGLKALKPGQIVHTVMSEACTDEPHRLISASVGIALPKDHNQYGYLSEHHAFGEKAIVSGEYAEDIAATMLATTLGIPFDPNRAWDERKQAYTASGHIFKTKNICQSAEGNKDGLWTTVLASAVFIID